MQRGGDGAENCVTNFNQKANVQIRWLLTTIDANKQQCLCFLLYINLLKNQAVAAAALTFAVVGRGEVGEFPQQPSLLSIPAAATNSQSNPACLSSLHPSPSQ